MPIFLTGYDTRAGKGLVTAPIVSLIQRAVVQTNFADKNAR